ncbi:MAG: patatin-like phospholipase family protein [Anaerolineae bacterium]
MIAFVLSGGGNRAAIQVGALQVLFEHGIYPDMLVGTSAGAINAAYLAPDPCRERLDELAQLWRKVTKDDVYPGNRLRVLWRLLTRKESVYPNDRWQRFLERHIEVRRFAEIKAVKLYIVAAELDSGAMRLFGQNGEESVLDALMASTALPPLHPPWRLGEERCIDGGTVANLPVRVAVEKGAKVIYALHAVNPLPPASQLRDLFNIANQAVGTLLRQQLVSDLERTALHHGVELHHIQLTPPLQPAFWDFSHATELIEAGRQAAEAYLAAYGSPRPGVHQRIGDFLARMGTGSLRKSKEWITGFFTENHQDLLFRTAGSSHFSRSEAAEAATTNAFRREQEGG